MIFLILITLTVYNLRNFDRIKKEINIYKYNIFSTPYFYVPDVKSEIITSSNGLVIYKPKDNMRERHLLKGIKPVVLETQDTLFF